MLEGPKIVENLFFAVTCISIFTCTIRSDYNFAMGLLSYYLIKNCDNSSKRHKQVETVSFRTRVRLRNANLMFFISCLF